VNDINLPGTEARTPVYKVLNAGTSNNNQVYTCVVSNSAGVLTSAPALLNVQVDTVPPTVVRAEFLATNAARIVFSEPVGLAGATNKDNYVFTNGLPVTRAVLSADLTSVDLATGPLVFGSNYVIVVNNIRDRARTPNYIALNTLVPLLATPYIPEGIGSPTPPGTVLGLPDGYDLAGGGRDIGSTTDQFQYFYQTQRGDFDLKVRVKSLSQTDPFAEAGLMARADLTAGSRFAATLTTPSLSGSFFLSRAASGGAAANSGNLPVNFPYTWLRLKRTGDQFTGFASYDGIAWQQLGTVSLPMVDPIYLGMAVSSHNLSQTAVAQFRDIAAVTNATTSVLSLPNEPAGPRAAAPD
jgi:regulation of enolase protein 1 (concanavalin A-like superfamily)